MFWYVRNRFVHITARGSRTIDGDESVRPDDGRRPGWRRPGWRRPGGGVLGGVLLLLRNCCLRNCCLRNSYATYGSRSFNMASSVTVVACSKSISTKLPSSLCMTLLASMSLCACQHYGRYYLLQVNHRSGRWCTFPCESNLPYCRLPSFHPTHICLRQETVVGCMTLCQWYLTSLFHDFLVFLAGLHTVGGMSNQYTLYMESLLFVIVSLGGVMLPS